MLRMISNMHFKGIKSFVSKNKCKKKKNQIIEKCLNGCKSREDWRKVDPVIKSSMGVVKICNAIL